MKKHRLNRIFILLTIFFCCSCQQQEKYYIKNLTFPENISLDEKVEMASRLVPSRQQLEWQKIELSACLNFGINTFTGREWGDGQEDAQLFNPTELDAEQWVKTLKECGFKMAIITAKHHDGFCLWQTKTTQHSVAASPWKNGKGDVIKEVSDACHKYGIKLGIYLSPWDRNAESYGDSEKYNDFFKQQLTELLTHYGKIHEVWFDGASVEDFNGKKQVYNWDDFYQTVYQLQPDAVIAIMGDDVRWVGNDNGYARVSEWSTTPLVPGSYARSEKVNRSLNIRTNSNDLGSRNVLKNATELFWYPSEVSVSIRPGLFYRSQHDQQVKTANQLVDIYYNSVGSNSSLLLHIPPDKRGLLHENDVMQLRKFAAHINTVFNENLITNNIPHHNLKEGSQTTYQLNEKEYVNVFMIQEDISRGQRIESFKLEAYINDRWECVANGTTIGHKRLIRFPQVETDKFRLTINKSRNRYNISQVGGYYEKPLNEIKNRDLLTDKSHDVSNNNDI